MRPILSMSDSGSLEQPIEEWPYLDQEVLLRTRSRKVCMTSHWFRHHAGPNCIPLLTSPVVARAGLTT
ncbi:hypothetical protein [Synechococcus sp. CBW1006]|uniref:hypothetical protein n=2 Tax=unclassified Synechococcus TaxID=2626047 RepID=UPI001E540205|nr:hypothetical protein [Synechococcus sp. CBW1006]